MTNNAWVIGAAIIIAGFLIGGRYSVTSGSQFNAFVIDRLTGAVSICYLDGGCRQL